ncbi:hypothetical protein DH2020_011100 [Rehmannia glutinosa]|uniref:Protein LNK1 n=1 Tax=Rehmannia glutinosa TaxID=99300 RepID=A0ABR0XCH8_REHGL
MSDLCLDELEDIVWDDFGQSDDHIVPHPSSDRADGHSILCDSHKKHRHEVTSISNSTGDRSYAGYVDQGKEQEGFSSLSKRRNTMLEKDSWSHAPSGVFPSSSDSNSNKEASSIASENTTSSHHVIKSNKTDSNNDGYCANDAILGDKTTTVDNNSFSDPLGDITHAGNDLDLFENTEDKNSSDFLYYGWPEIGNFEDVDRMFRSCDSTFGLGASKEDELGWFTSADNIGDSGDMVKSEFEFPCPELDPVEYISQNHDSPKSNSMNDCAMTKDSSWTSEKSDSYMSFVTGPAMADSKDRFIPTEQVPLAIIPIVHKLMESVCVLFMHVRLDRQFTAFENNSPLSDLTSVNPTPSGVKSETNDLTSPTPRDSSHASNRLQSLESSHDPPFPVAAPAVIGKREKQHNHQGKQVHYSGDKSENHSDTEGVSLVIPAELGSSHIQENSTMSSGMDDISQEAASFHQLQLVMEQLDLRTKICIRDSLYRLARSAEQRHNHANLNGSCGDERDANGAFMAEGANNFMDIETDTNPIDRSIAHLLFHRPSESSPMPAHDSLPFKSASAVRGIVTSPPVMVENLVNCEETASEIEDSDR